MTAKDQQRLSSPGFGTFSPSLLDDLIQVHLLSISNRSCPLPMCRYTLRPSLSLNTWGRKALPFSFPVLLAIGLYLLNLFFSRDREKEGKYNAPSLRTACRLPIWARGGWALLTALEVIASCGGDTAVPSRQMWDRLINIAAAQKIRCTVPRCLVAALLQWGPGIAGTYLYSVYSRSRHRQHCLAFLCLSVSPGWLKISQWGDI